MHALVVLDFYGLLVCSTVGGFVFFFQVGRFGMAQVGHLFDATPMPNFTNEDFWRLVGAATGRPTSIPDFLYSLTPIGWLTSLRSCIILLGRSPSYAFARDLIGGFIGKLWYTVSIPLLALEMVLGEARRQVLAAVAHGTPCDRL